ncbi:uncharacterized protein EDB91DRAFT_1114259 [Suillus paluster]|uniref:uncharacterized protein n=1 Tax=Suillus paluster TaxID=48578 RepID=UPI001B87080B|nr:uncharacterized protein EDB91DRAFT_1114259 [Suillus paluster]KAG1748476.1 hypothetical protein EDB91DRAFT_1114259 [Suillus paluster]
MHRCLCLSEILEVIFHSVFNSVEAKPDRFRLCGLPGVLPSPPYIPDRRSVLHLALTCHTFRDPALNVLYSHLTDKHRFIKSLPTELLELVHSSRPSVAEQFRPFVLCAARVQILDDEMQVIFDPCHNDTAYALILASAPKVAPGLLFPKLHSLTWYDERLASIPALTLLLPTIETLSISIADTQFREAIIPRLHTAAPRLKALELECFSAITDYYPTEIESLLLSYTDGLTEFSFQCCEISSTLLHIIALWPRLRWLGFSLGSTSIPTVPLHVSQPFQTLVHLHISCQHLDHFMSFLRALQMLRMDSDGSSSWSELLSVLARIKLQHIILTDKCHDLGEQSCPTSFEFRPLLAHPTAFADLKTLILFPDFRSSSIALTDSDILTLARTCPNLNVLELGLRNTPVSLYTLSILAGRCRELREVSLCVDARLDALGAIPLINDNDKREVDLQPNTHLIKLDIGESPIACVGPLHPPTAPDLMRSIPRFLHAMAPRVERIWWTLGTGQFQEMYAKRWEIVSDVTDVSFGGDVLDVV